MRGLTLRELLLREALGVADLGDANVDDDFALDFTADVDAASPSTAMFVGVDATGGSASSRGMEEGTT